MIDGKRLEAFCALACVCVPWLVACQQGIRTRGPTSTAGQSNGRVWSSWLLGGALVADGIDVDAPFIAQQFQHMGKLALALIGLPIGGYFLGLRALHFRFPVSVPLRAGLAFFLSVLPLLVLESLRTFWLPGCALGLFGFPFRWPPLGHGNPLAAYWSSLGFLVGGLHRARYLKSYGHS